MKKKLSGLLSRILLGVFLTGTFCTESKSQNRADVNLNMRHSVNGVYEFDRKKYINLHSAVTEQDWNGEEDKLEYMLNGLDVYLGRDNGGMCWYLNQSKEDPNRKGYVDPLNITQQANNAKTEFWGKTHANKHKYDERLDVMIGGQPQCHWTPVTTKPYLIYPVPGIGYEITQPDAIGEFMGRYVNEFYRKDNEPVAAGHRKPKFLEILNEPLYHLVDEGTHTPAEVFQFHNDVATSIRKFNTEVAIGGYTAAFPYFDDNNFRKWEERDKLFIDMSGNYMDYFSIHIYDFEKYWNPGNTYTGPRNFKGSRVEATMDMMEHYSQIKLGTIKPFMISEYGGRDLQMEQGGWSAYRDWIFMKSFSPLMMQFMERPDKILKAIPYVPIKAEWGRGTYPFPWRLLRQESESGGTSSAWVFTELVKFYQLWSDVKGSRVDSYVETEDVLIDAYVNGNKAYIILSNLNFSAENLKLNIKGTDSNPVQNVRIKKLFLGEANVPVLQETIHHAFDGNIQLEPEATAIIELTFETGIVINELLDEKKFYANTYYHPIVANQPMDFSLNNISKGLNGEAVLRIGVGRAHGLSLSPEVWLNGEKIQHPVNYKGDAQVEREGFFGLLEVKVPYDLLQANNTVSLKFPDNGGKVSSLGVQVFNATKKLRRPGEPQNIAPVASFKYAINKFTVNFDASESSDPDGVVVDWAWNFGDGNTGAGKTINHTYAAPGDYPVTLVVKDDEGKRDTLTSVVSIKAAMYVESIVKYVVNNANGSQGANKKDNQALAEVQIKEVGGNPVANAYVTITFSGGITETVSAYTNTSGVAYLFSTQTQRKLSVNDFEVCVNNVTNDTYAYESSSNKITCTGNNAGTTTYSAARSGRIESENLMIQEENKGFRIYPNPAYESIKIDMHQHFNEIQIFNASGILVKTIKTFTNKIIEVNVKNFKPGIYFIRGVQKDNNIVTEKVLVKPG